MAMISLTTNLFSVCHSAVLYLFWFFLLVVLQIRSCQSYVGLQEGLLGRKKSTKVNQTNLTTLQW